MTRPLRIAVRTAVVLLATGAAAAAYRTTRPELADGDWAEARRADLVLEVEMSGALRSDRSELFGPPQVRRTWRYKIANLADEGTQVAAGDMLVTFDPSEHMRKLEDKQAEMESAAKQIEKERTNLTITARDDRLALEELEARRRKLVLQLDVPPELARAREHQELRQGLRLVERELAFVREREAAGRRAGEASIAYYQDRHDRAASRVAEIKDAIKRMTVTAPRAGVVVYIPDDNGQKRKPGDVCWIGDRLIELPDLTAMHGRGEVAEAESGRLRVGQRVRVRLDAHADDELTGRVRSIHSFVKRQSADVPLKVVRVDVSLDHTDPQRMRPGMRFRGWVETARAEKVLQVPAEAVFPTSDGPVVYRRTLTGHERVVITTGRRTRTAVEVTSGLEEGDEIALIDLEENRA